MASSPDEPAATMKPGRSLETKPSQTRSTRGPLDISDPNALGPLKPSAPQVLSPGQPSPYPGISSPKPPSQASDHPTKDFGYLLRPELYHTLSSLEIPPSFRDKQPAADTPLDTLLSTGHFRAAAIAAANQLTTSTSAIDHVTIFRLFYIRLACLTLCNETALAVQEVKALEDLNSAYYRADATSASSHLVPWELRVMAVRLQGIGFNDSRKGVMGYYDLAGEARLMIRRLRDQADPSPAEREMWEARLAELGILVASALVEMGDLSGAAHHLSTLPSLRGQASVAFMKALLYIFIGDVAAAEACLPDISTVAGSEETEAISTALICLSSGDFPRAVTAWKGLREKDADQALYAHNLAVTLIYTNQMAEAREVLEALVERGHAFHALTMNLSIVYELCTERSKGMKVALAEKVAAVEGAGRRGKGGWDKVNADFRL